MEVAAGGGLVEATTSALRSRIASGQWPVGTRIPTEPELCELLGVGRSTVREAVRSLTTLGLLEPLTARGTFVRATTPAPTILVDALSAYAPAELVGLRRAIDVEAAQTAAANWTADDLRRMEAVLQEETDRLRAGGERRADGTHCARFHGAVVGASGNRLLIDLDAGLSAGMLASGLDARKPSPLSATSWPSRNAPPVPARARFLMASTKPRPTWTMTASISASACRSRSRSPSRAMR